MEEFVNRIHQDQRDYLDWVAELSPREIISRAYEICYRDEIASILESDYFDEDEMAVLMQIPNPVGVLYEAWLNTDASVCSMLTDVIRDFIKGE